VDVKGESMTRNKFYLTATLFTIALFVLMFLFGDCGQPDTHTKAEVDNLIDQLNAKINRIDTLQNSKFQEVYHSLEEIRRELDEPGYDPPADRVYFLRFWMLNDSTMKVARIPEPIPEPLDTLIDISWNPNPPEEGVRFYWVFYRPTELGKTYELWHGSDTIVMKRVDELSYGEMFFYVTASDSANNMSAPSEERQYTRKR